MRYGSVCSGIEAASVAWEPLGWQPAWFAEIEPFPSAVLAHHWPHVPNLGDMTMIRHMVHAGVVEAPDVLVGGTPCQAFSVAGLRGGLSDERGQLTLEFVRLANAIDEQREQPAIIVWENVPGVLSSKDNAFGCFIAGLSGHHEPIVNPAGRWPNAGLVIGPSRAVAWRVLDAQYFGVAQRRRRVFVVASARADFDPAAVLFEFEGMRRDIAPSREAREEVAATSGAGAAIGSPEFDKNGLQRVVGTLCADTHPGAYSGQDAYTGRLVPSVFAIQNATRGKDQNGLGVAQDAPMYTLDQGSQHAVAHVDFMPTMVSGGSTEASHNQMSGQLREGYVVPAMYGFNSNAQVDQMRITEEKAETLTCSQYSAALVNMQVRRLTPTECERLQGFPDGHTMLPGRPADGPRYKALGNSMAVPCMRWIGCNIG
jgi:DNA (cytosine-5)-methyltransferase 1